MSDNDQQRLPQWQTSRLGGLASEALRHWAFPYRELSLIKYRENAVFKVVTEDGEPFALRLHRPGYHDDAALRSELQWLEALAGVGVPPGDSQRRLGWRGRGSVPGGSDRLGGWPADGGAR